MNKRPSVFITGAAAGIGRATAERFARGGWFVGLYDVNEAGVRALQQQLGDAQACAGALDVTDAGAFARALAAFWEAAGQRLDLLFNNAGICAVGDFDALPLARQQALVDVNVKGVINGCHAAFPYLRRTPGARVLSMSSGSAIYGTPGFASYCATKFAVKGLSEALDLEWRRHGIRVMDLLPLFVDTPMVASFETHPSSMDMLGMRLAPADIAETAWRAAHWRWWPRVHWYPGVQAWLTALLQKLTPGWLTRFSTRLITKY